MQASILKRIKGIKHSFGNFQEPKSGFVRATWAGRARKKQVHATNIAVAEAGCKDFVEADGIYTTEKNLLLPVVNADCYPLLLSRRDGQAIAALHIGWRGALHGILYQFDRLLKEQHDDITQWVAAIG